MTYRCHRCCSQLLPHFYDTTNSWLWNVREREFHEWACCTCSILPQYHAWICRTPKSDYSFTNVCRSSPYAPVLDLLNLWPWKRLAQLDSLFFGGCPNTFGTTVNTENGCKSGEKQKKKIPRNIRQVFSQDQVGTVEDGLGARPKFPLQGSCYFKDDQVESVHTYCSSYLN